jgi:high-affinity Fe2+/Pb2+ permease
MSKRRISIATSVLLGAWAGLFVVFWAIPAIINNSTLIVGVLAILIAVLFPLYVTYRFTTQWALARKYQRQAKRLVPGASVPIYLFWGLDDNRALYVLREYTDMLKELQQLP